MTLHSAKGLEFRAVVVAGLEDGLLPHFNSQGAREDVEEERRLLYVGMTRARERLYLTCCRRRRIAGRYQDQAESPFLAELPDQLLDDLSRARTSTTPSATTGAPRASTPSSAAEAAAAPAAAGLRAARRPSPARPAPASPPALRPAPVRAPSVRLAPPATPAQPPPRRSSAAAASATPRSAPASCSSSKAKATRPASPSSSRRRGSGSWWRSSRTWRCCEARREAGSPARFAGRSIQGCLEERYQSVRRVARRCEDVTHARRVAPVAAKAVVRELVEGAVEG